jgi:hypothetical protein
MEQQSLQQISQQPGSTQGSKKRPRDEKGADDPTVCNGDNQVAVTIITGDGVSINFLLPTSTTVLGVKLKVERELGIGTDYARLFAHDEAREVELQNHETLGSCGARIVLMSLLVTLPDAQQVVPELQGRADMILGDGIEFNKPLAAAFVPGYADWLAITEYNGDRGQGEGGVGRGRAGESGVGRGGG